MTPQPLPDDGAARPFERDWRLERIVAPVARALAAVYFRARVHGAERIPGDRPVIFVGKHPRTYLYLETLLLGLFAFWDSGRPPIRVLEQRGTSVHRTPVLGWLRRHVHGIPARPEPARAALARGESLLIFPGGTRELYGAPDELRWDGRTGFARLALEARAPIVPFAIVGADQQHPFRLAVRGGSIWLPPVPLPVALDYWFGEPIAPLSPSGDADRDVRAHAQRVGDATRALLAAGMAARGPRRPGRSAEPGVSRAAPARTGATP